MSENDTPARRLTAAEQSPKAGKPKSSKGLVLKGRKHVVKPFERNPEGTPQLPHPRGIKPSPARVLTEEQMDAEHRERGEAASLAELQRSRKDP